MSQLNGKSYLTFPEESHKIIGAAMSVHRFFGCGFAEKVYQDAFEVELRKAGIPYCREKQLHAIYAGILINFGEPSLRFERFPNSKFYKKE
jgi:hypothetical protein